MDITADRIARLCPRPAKAALATVWDGYVDAMTSPQGGALIDRYGVITELRWSFAVATWAVETGGFTVVWENLNYTADRILQVFRDKGITEMAEARRLAGNPYALAERVYGLGCPRMAQMLGNTQPGDGFKFRGLGIEQLTGRAAHERAAARIGCSLEDLAQPLNGLHGALIEWDEKRCNVICDADDGMTDTAARRVRKAINGGLNGMPQFRQYLVAARRIWPGGNFPSRQGAIVQIGDNAHGVKQAQELLTQAGYPCGACDGKFGTLTERALAGFQVAHGLPGTGRLDDATWAALKDAAANPPAAATVARENMTLDDLRERGSETVANADNVSLVGRVLTTTAAVGGADHALNLGGVDAVLTQVEQVQEMASRTHSLLGLVTSGRFLLIIVLLGLGFLLWRWGRRINWARLKDAVSGANVAR